MADERLRKYQSELGQDVSINVQTHIAERRISVERLLGKLHVPFTDRAVGFPDQSASTGPWGAERRKCLTSVTPERVTRAA